MMFDVESFMTAATATVYLVNSQGIRNNFPKDQVGCSSPVKQSYLAI
jgi:hypothetical protein